MHTPESELALIVEVTTSLSKLLADQAVVGGNRETKLRALADKIGACTVSNIRYQEPAWEPELVQNIRAACLHRAQLTAAVADAEQSRATGKLAKYTIVLAVATCISAFGALGTALLTYWATTQ